MLKLLRYQLPVFCLRPRALVTCETHSRIIASSLPPCPSQTTKKLHVGDEGLSGLVSSDLSFRNSIVLAPSVSTHGFYLLTSPLRYLEQHRIAKRDCATVSARLVMLLVEDKRGERSC
jgi:hypothetical protein